jgi:hypothetical protein
MSLAVELADLATAIGNDVQALQARTQILVLATGAAIPGGTPAGTVIVRT